MKEKYPVPLHFSAGKHSLAELPVCSDNEDVLFLSVNKLNYLSYTVPVYGGRFEDIYVTEEMLEKCTVFYGEDGRLKNIKMSYNGRPVPLLVYIYFPDMASAERHITDFVVYNAEKIAEMIKKRFRGKRLARLFTVYSYGDGMNYSAVPVSEDDLQRPARKYGADSPASYDGGIFCDLDTLHTMLLCSDTEHRRRLFYLAADIMNEFLNDHLNDIDKTDDFKFTPIDDSL